MQGYVLSLFGPSVPVIVSFFGQKVELTRIIDTSGAFIPDHGTPTVILVGRNQIPRESLPVRAVLAQLHAVEAACGRERAAPKWGPRTMDLDVLLYGYLICDEAGLKLPRPDLLRRAYMLGPAAELAPDFMHPTEHRTLGELWREFRVHNDRHPMREVELRWTSRAGETRT